MNTLSWEPVPIDTEGGYGVQTFWRLLVDGRELTPDAHPFFASDEAVVSHECHDCYSCGSPDISVRRAGRHVLWFGRIDEVFEPGLSPDRILAFEAEAYQRSLNSGDVSSLPELLPSEIHALITAQGVADWHDGLYRLPDSDEDPQGQIALRLLAEAFEQPDSSLEVTGPPEKPIELRIGLELPGIPECVWHVGREGGQLVFRFDALPAFPLWLAGSRLDEKFCEHFEGAFPAPDRREDPLQD